MAETNAAPSSVGRPARAGTVGSGDEEGSPGTDARDKPDDVTLDGRADEPDKGWPGPIEEPPPLFAS